MSVATLLESADTKSADTSCFVTDTYLPKFNAGTVPTGKFADKGAEIHSMVSGEEKSNFVAIELTFDIDNFHGQAVTPHRLDNFVFVLDLVGLMHFVSRPIFLSGRTKD